MAATLEITLPPPPGRHRGESFCQTVRNCTSEQITLNGYKQSIELSPNEEIEICWEYREGREGMWKFKLYS